MTGEEIEGQRRELFGAEVAHCDLCQMPVPAGRLRPAESSHPVANGDRPFMICPACQEGILSGELDLQSLLLEEDERQEPDDEY